MNRRHRRAASNTTTSTGSSPMPGNAVAQLLAQAASHYQAGQLREASQLSRQVLALDPQNIAALHLTGLLALQAGLDDAAIDIFTSAIRLKDDIADLHAAIAEALQRTGRLDEAVRHFQRAIALDPDDAATLYNFANVLLKLTRYDEALAGYDRALALQPRFAQAIHNRGNTLFELQRYGEALADYDRALAINPRFVQALGNRANALVQLRRYDEALATCEQALAIDSRHVPALAMRGNAFYELRRFGEAAAAFQQTLAVDPDYPYAEGRALTAGCCVAIGPDTRRRSRRSSTRSPPAGARLHPLCSCTCRIRPRRAGNARKSTIATDTSDHPRRSGDPVALITSAFASPICPQTSATIRWLI